METAKWSDKITYRQALAFCVWWFIVGVSVGWILHA